MMILLIVPGIGICLSLANLRPTGYWFLPSSNHGRTAAVVRFSEYLWIVFYPVPSSVPSYVPWSRPRPVFRFSRWWLSVFILSNPIFMYMWMRRMPKTFVEDDTSYLLRGSEAYPGLQGNHKLRIIWCLPWSGFFSSFWVNCCRQLHSIRYVCPFGGWMCTGWNSSGCYTVVQTTEIVEAPLATLQ